MTTLARIVAFLFILGVAFGLVFGINLSWKDKG